MQDIVPALVFALPICASVYYAFHLPVSYDEAWTFLNFTRDPIAAATTYPAPNNHVFHSLLTCISSSNPIFPALFNLRLPALIIYFATLIYIFRFIRTNFSVNLAAAIVAIASMLFINIYYAYMSRGYGMITFCVAVSLGCSFDLYNKRSALKSWMILALASVAGFYTMPSYLYFFVLLNLLMLYLRFDFRRQVLFNIGVSAVVCLLYLPIILSSGIFAITDNPYVRPIGFIKTLRSLPAFAIQVLQETTGISWIVVGVLCVVGLLKYHFKEQKKWLPLIVIVTPFLLLLAHDVIPFVRTFNYYGLILILLILIPFRHEIGRLPTYLLIPLLIIIQASLLFNFHQKIYQYENKDMAANITASEIIPTILGNNRYLVNDALLGANLEFELVTNNYNYVLRNVSEPSMAAESISGFDYVIIRKESDVSGITPIHATEYYNVYKRN